jgi:hypothetical protein
VNRAVEECTAPETPYYSTRVGSPMAGVCRVEIGRGERGQHCSDGELRCSDGELGQDTRNRCPHQSCRTS